MDVQKLSMDRDAARDLYAAYQQHRGKMTHDDRAIAAIYKRIAAGKLVIRALASVTAAGLGADQLPKLALARADQKRISCVSMSERVSFRPVTQARCTLTLPMPGASWNTRTRIADVPLIPVHLRPRSALDKYFILWEADWSAYPVDPYLLRRFGEDAWIVVAAWDLTAVERAVMSSKLNG